MMAAIQILQVLIAYKGKVYDVTASYPWAMGSHWGAHQQARTSQDVSRRQSINRRKLVTIPSDISPLQ